MRESRQPAGCGGCGFELVCAVHVGGKVARASLRADPFYKLVKASA